MSVQVGGWLGGWVANLSSTGAGTTTWTELGKIHLNSKNLARKSFLGPQQAFYCPPDQIFGQFHRLHYTFMKE